MKKIKELVKIILSDVLLTKLSAMFAIWLVVMPLAVWACVAFLGWGGLLAVFLMLWANNMGTAINRLTELMKMKRMT